MLHRSCLVIALLVGLCGCDTVGGAVLASASLVSYVHTDKTLADHAVSFVTEKNCSIRHTANNRPYCQEPEVQGPEHSQPDETLAQAEPSYCYRTLGKISCYREPDPHASSYAAMQ